MRHAIVTECRVRPGKMQDFLQAVQRWEQDAMSLPTAPSHHAVYFGHDDASRVLVVTQFSDASKAESFAATGLLDAFRDQILACTLDGAGGRTTYDLFYASGPAGPNVVFGEEA